MNMYRIGVSAKLITLWHNYETENYETKNYETEF